MSGGALRRVLVIGISGTTNSGKTTIVKELVEKYGNSCSIGQDLFFLAPGDARLEPLYIPELDHHNWEDYRALEMDKMVTAVRCKINELNKSIKDEPAVLFVEGFSIFGWKPLLQFFDKKYFLTLSREVCESRRKKTSYIPPDVPGYFESVVWPEYLKHKEDIKPQEDIVYVDGNEGTEKLYNLVCSDISTFTTSAR